MINKQHPYHQHITTLVVFTTFSVWLLGFVFDASYFYFLHPNHDFDTLVLSTIVAHIIGYLFFIVIIRNPSSATIVIRFGLLALIASALMLMFTSWSITLFLYFLSSFIASGIMVGLAYHIKYCIKSSQRFNMMAVILITSNIGLFILTEIETLFDSMVSIWFAFGLLVVSFFCSFYMERVHINVDVKHKHSSKLHAHTKRDLYLLSLLIFIITINGGLMYQVIVPSYVELGEIVRRVWLWPYMIGVGMFLFFFTAFNKGTTLILAVAILGFSFVGYLVAPISVLSFLIVIFLLMIPLGALDLFWWGTLAQMLDESNNPGFVFGVGMIANILGVLTGILFSMRINNMENATILAVAIALTSVFVVLAIFPLLQSLLQNKSYLQTYYSKPLDQVQHDPVLLEILSSLTKRELEITEKIIQGKTYKMISEDLHVSVNTIKFHIKTIYDKFDVNSRFELVKLFEITSEYGKLPIVGSDKY